MEHTAFENIVFVIAVIINIVAMYIIKDAHDNERISSKTVIARVITIFVVTCIIARMMGVE